MKFATRDILSTCTGRLVGEIEGVYAVLSFLVGRPVFTHELPDYSRASEKVLRETLTDLPGTDDFKHVNADNYLDILKEWEGRLGAEISLPKRLRGCLRNH